MRTKYTVIIAFASILLTGACSVLQKQTEIMDKDELEKIHPMLGLEETEADNKYSQLVDSAMENPADIDYQELRMVYARTSGYSPYAENEDLEKIRKLLDSEQYEVATEVVKTVYHTQFHVPMFHFYAYAAWKESGNDKMAKLHSMIFNELMQSILKSGDGKSAKTAWVVINISEEYRVLEFLEMEMQSQSLVTENNRNYDRMEVIDENGEEDVVYFNIDIPFRELLKEEQEENVDE
ncbi:MAG: DUF4919 domain-containing protein [Bacteroidales bacterium]